MNVLRSSFIFSFFTLISRLFGFIRDIFVANFLGTGFSADIFFVAFRFPNTFRRIFSEGALNSAFVPIYSKLVSDNLTDQSQKFAGSIFLLFLIICSIVVILIEIFMPYFILIIAPGFLSNEEKFDELVRIARIVFPFLILISITSIYSSILNSNNKFALSAALPIILNLVLILSLLIAYYTSSNYLIFLSWSVIVAGIIQVLLLSYALRKQKIIINFTKKIISNNTKRFVKLFSASFFSSGLLQINILIGTVIASYESGAISYLYYSDRVYQLPLALIGIAIGTTLLPSISSKIKNETREKINQTIEQTLLFALIFSVPASVGIYALSEQIISVLFERGEFDNESTLNTSEALKFYSIGLIAFIVMKIYTPIFFAYENAKPTLYVTAINLIFNTSLSIVLFIYIGFTGIALATSISAWLSILVMYYFLEKNNYYKITKSTTFPIIVVILSSIGMYFYLILLKKNSIIFLHFFYSNEIIFLLFSVLSSILLYLILISFYKPFKFAHITKILKNE